MLRSRPVSPVEIGVLLPTREAIMSSLQRFVAVGARHIVLRFGGGDQAEQLERATRELLPRLKG